MSKSFNVATSNLSGTFNLSADISPPQLTTNVSNYNPSGLSSASVLRLSSDQARTITGLAGGSDGRVVIFQNINTGVGAADITLSEQSTLSTPENRFSFGSDTPISPGKSVILQYDSISLRWRSLATSNNISAFASTFLDDTSDSAVRTTIRAQESSPNLAALASLSPTLDTLAYFTGNNTASITPLTSFARNLIAAQNDAAARVVLGTRIGTDVQAQSATLTSLSSIVGVADRIPYFDGPGSMVSTPFTSLARSLVGGADQASMRSTLGVFSLAEGTRVSIATNSSSVLFSGIATGAKHIIINLNNVNFTNGALTMLLGTAGGVDTISNYSGNLSVFNTSSVSTISNISVGAFSLTSTMETNVSGQIHLSRIDSFTNTWTLNSSLGNNTNTGVRMCISNGSKTLPLTIDRIQLVPLGPFSSGTINILVFY